MIVISHLKCTRLMDRERETWCLLQSRSTWSILVQLPLQAAIWYKHPSTCELHLTWTFLCRRILTADLISFWIASTFIFKLSLLDDDVYWQVVKMCSWLENNFGSLSERDWGQLYLHVSMYNRLGGFLFWGKGGEEVGLSLFSSSITWPYFYAWIFYYFF